MFDDITHPEKRSGIRGFVARYLVPEMHPDAAKDARRAALAGAGVGLASAAVLLVIWATLGMFLSLGPCGFGETPRWWRPWVLVIPLVSVPMGLAAWNRVLMRDTREGGGTSP